jgi:hypothetical protein
MIGRLARRLPNSVFESSAQERIFLPKCVLGSNERLWRWPRFTDQSDLPQKLTDLRVIARAHRRVRAAGISYVDTEVLHRGLHHWRQTVGSPFPGK